MDNKDKAHHEQRHCYWCEKPAKRIRKDRFGIDILLCDDQTCLSREWKFDDER